jgi:hypothetical protein
MMAALTGSQPRMNNVTRAYSDYHHCLPINGDASPSASAESAQEAAVPH